MAINKQAISEEFSSGNFSFCYDYFADNMEWKVIGGDTQKGKATVISYCDKMTEVIGISSLTNTKVIAGKDDFAIEGICNYTDGANRARELNYCDIYHFENEKLAAITSYCIEQKVSEN